MQQARKKCEDDDTLATVGRAERESLPGSARRRHIICMHARRLGMDVTGAPLGRPEHPGRPAAEVKGQGRLRPYDYVRAQARPGQADVCARV